MDSRVTLMLTERAVAIHAHLLAAACEPDVEQFTQWLAPNVPSVGWHLWHMARWADRVHAILPIMVAERRRPRQSEPEMWEAESLASKWGFEVASLGYGQTGMEMGDRAASTLRLPDREGLVDYARRAFAAAETTFRGIADDHLAMRGPDLLYAGRVDRERSVGETVVGHVSHASRHLGTMEGIRPLLLQKPGSMTF